MERQYCAVFWFEVYHIMDIMDFKEKSIFEESHIFRRQSFGKGVTRPFDKSKTEIS